MKRRIIEMPELNSAEGIRISRKYNTNFSKLVNLIIEMTEAQQFILLQQATQLTDRRKWQRIPCLIPVRYRIGRTVYSSYILDISECGAFVETSTSFPIGLTVWLKYLNPFSLHFSKIMGKITWSRPYAIGLQFYEI